MIIVRVWLNLLNTMFSRFRCANDPFCSSLRPNFKVHLFPYPCAVHECPEGEEAVAVSFCLLWSSFPGSLILTPASTLAVGNLRGPCGQRLGSHECLRSGAHHL